MAKAIDLSGQTFNEWSIIKRDTSRLGTNSYWFCKCSCGKICSVNSSSLKKGASKSCGHDKFLPEDLEGQQFGRLTVLHYDDTRGNGYWICRCSCDKKIKSVYGGSLRAGTSTSCGCIQKLGLAERDRKNPPAKTHGLTKTRLFTVWENIKGRCYNENNHAYHNYGGRGIIVYSEWIENVELFIGYVKSLDNYGTRGYSLDRINNNGNYEPGNLRWADKNTQARNRRVTVLCIEIVRKIRELHKKGIKSSDIMDLYCVNKSDFYKIINNKTWKELI